MTVALMIRVFDENRLCFVSGELEGMVELGRQAEDQEQVYSKSFDAGRWRVVMASMEENAVSRRHAALESLDRGRARLANLSSLIPLFLADGSEVGPKASVELALPTTLKIGRKMIRIDAAEPEEGELHRLTEATLAPG